MPRNSAILSVCWASLGRCSLISMPGTLVWIGLNSPAPALCGLRSNVSLWLGPPSIHSRMHDLVLSFAWAARVARTLSQPDIEAPSTPAADSLTKSRRDNPLRIADCGLRIEENMIGSSAVGGRDRAWRL